MHKCLKELFDAILQFARSQDVLYMSLLEQKAAARQHAATVGYSAKSGGWGAVGEVSDAQLGGVTIEQRLTDQMVSSAAEYKSRFGRFFALVREHGAESYDLAFFAFRLARTTRGVLADLSDAEAELRLHSSKKVYCTTYRSSS